MTYPRPIRVLLLGSLLLTAARAMTLPYIVVFLASALGLTVLGTGLLVGGSLVLGVCIGMYGGYAVDRLPAYPLNAALILVIAACFLAAFVCQSSVAFFLLLTILNSAYAVLEASVKACFAGLLPAARRGSVFSLKYTLTNIAFAAGPVIGVALVAYNASFPFLASGMVSLIYFSVFLAMAGELKNIARPAKQGAGFLQTLHDIGADRRLVLFTAGGCLSGLVLGQFAAYLSQYLIATEGAELTYKIIGALVTTNAVVVILSQFWLGSLIQGRSLLLWLLLGLALLLAGELGFAFAATTLAWVLAMIVFSLGETVVVPAEYLFIDRIAPDAMRGSYYAAQNLTNIGAALGPIMCGAIIAWSQPHYIFHLLVGSVLASGALYYAGTKAKPSQASVMAGRDDGRSPADLG
jgi:MFS family permease